jgi:predicted nucleic acid-binding protein
MTGLDTSFLVALSAREHERHREAREFLAVQAQREEFALTAAVLSEFIHAVTDARRFRQPFTMAEALNDAEAWWTASNVTQLAPTDEAVKLCFAWMSRHQLGRKRILDTMLAATLHTTGATRLLTLNPADFRIFGEFELLVP